jgi:hypothetical protein
MRLVKQESLLDTLDDRPIDYLLVYSGNAPRLAWFTRFLDPEFEHVDVWFDLGLGYYLALRPYHDSLQFHLVEGRPDGRVQRVRARRRSTRAMLPFGLKTCVSVAKAALGIRNAFIVTPRQLYRYVEKHRGVV